MTSEEKPGKQKRKPKRKWLGRFGLIFAGLLLVLVIFHHPAIIALVRFAAVRGAASQHLRLQFDIEGNGLSELTFRNVRITPAGRTPIEEIRIESVHATYSIGGLLRHGPRNFLQACEVKNADMVFKDLSNDPLRKHSSKSHLDEDMHNWFFQPVYFIGHIKLENLNILARNSDGDFVLKEANADIEREKPGWLRIAGIQILKWQPWKNIGGRATISNTDILLEDVKLTPDITIDRLVSGPAPGEKNTCRLSAQGKVFGGALSVDYTDRKHGAQFDGDARLSATKFGLDGLGKFLDLPVTLGGAIDRIDAQCGGDPGSPASWRGLATASIIAPSGVGALKLDHADAKLVLENGVFRLETSELSGSANKVTGQAQGQLPANIGEFKTTALDGRFQIAAQDLSQSFSALTHGSIIAEGHFNLRDKEFGSEFLATCKEINSEKFDASQVDLKVALTKKLTDGSQPGRNALDDLTGRVTAQFQGARLDKYALDTGQVTVESKDGWIRLNAANLKREADSATLNAAWHPPADLSKWISSDFDVAFSVAAPNAAAFNAEPNLTGINGQFEADGNIAHRNGSFDGKININGTKLTHAEFKADSLSVGIVIEKSVADICTLQLVMDPRNQMGGSGRITLRKPFDYGGRIQANVSDLTVFNPVLEAAGIQDRIAGALTVDWNGSGQITEIHHNGQGEIKLSGGKYGVFQPITAEIAGKYSPESADIPAIHVRVDKTDFTAGIALHDTEIKIHDLLLQQGPVKLLQGGITLPLDLRTPTNPDSLIPSNGRIFANLSSDDINLETLLIQPKQTSPLKGTVKLSLNADGPLDNLVANMLLRGRNLQVKSAPAVAPGNLELNCDFKDNQLVLNGTLQQPAISPLQINGKIPFPLRQFIRQRKLDDQSPVELSLKLEKSPVTIISQLFPRIRFIEGQMEIDAKAAGTIARPMLSGVVALDLPAIRMSDPDAPAVNDFKANLEFAGNQVTVNRFSGGISGGSFNLTGRVLFQKLTDPVLDFRLTSQNALLLRNETLTVRADSDIKIAGDFNAAHVSGNVGLTKSKFFREVEILPIELPGRPAPKPSSESRMGFSLKPPLSNWTFDVAIKSKDPFLIRGNLTNGKAIIDLKLVGTGASPALEGMVRIDNFVASLPFSRLNIDYGYAYFSTDNPFVPALDIQGSSSLRDYNIRVYISGTPTDPVTVFTSEPPLPQDQIVALLGTGATTDELTGRSDVLAGRAAVLLLQKVYYKLFKHKQPQETDSFLTRFQLDAGAVDPRTGRQEVSARFKVSDQYYLVGDLDDQGGLRGQVRYLLRFR